MKPVEFFGPGRPAPAQRWTFERVLSSIHSVVQAVAADHAVAQTAAAQAESSRANVAEARALYRLPPAPSLDSDGGGMRADPPRANATTRTAAAGLQTWSAPLVKSAKHR